MKNTLVFIAFLTTFCFAASSYGQDSDGRNFYIGLGGSWAFEDFEQNDIDFDDMFSVEVDFDDTWGLDLKFGYHFNDFISLEAVYDHFSEFETDQSLSASTTLGSTSVSGTIAAEADLDISTFMLAGKASMPWKVRPFVVAGAGLIHARLDGELTASVSGDEISQSVSASESDTDVQACAKVGVGFDFFPTSHVSMGIEGAYVFSFSDAAFDLEPVLEDAEIDIRYFSLTAGLAYHF
jgi:opacity protein-like surface antigen